MPRIADETLTKITFNIYASDKVWLEERYGYGWSNELRQLIRKYRKQAEEFDE